MSPQAGMINHLFDAQRYTNTMLSQQLFHVVYHPLNGKRRYRRGRNRCPMCGGHLNIINLDTKGTV